MTLRAAVTVVVAALGWPLAARAQVPLPPLPPVGPAPPPPGQRPPQQGPPSPGPVSPAPGSVAEGVDVAHSGFFADDALVPPLVRRWRTKASVASMVAAEGKVYGAEPEAVVARAAGDGSEVWRAHLTYVSHLAYDGGMVFATAGDDLVALHAGSGAIAWRRHLADVAFAGAPVASGGAVYVTHDQGGGTLHAFRARDGQVLWKVSGIGGATAPALDDGKAYLAGACGNVAAYKRSDGSRSWFHRGGCSGGADVTPALHDGRVYSPEPEYSNDGSPGNPILSAADGNVVGRFLGLRPVFVDGLAIRRGDESLEAVDEASGGRVWQRKLGTSEALAVGHDVYAVSGGRLLSLDSEKGTTLWSLRVPTTEGTSTSSPRLAVAPGLLFVAAGGRVSAYESALKPAAGGIALGTGAADVDAGRPTVLVGLLGAQLRRQRPKVALAAARWRHGRFHRFTTAPPARDGGFAERITLFRNTRFRAAVGETRSNVMTLYAYPRVKLGRARRAGGGRLRVAARVRTPHTHVSGRTFVLYLIRAGARHAKRVASGRIHSGHATLVFRPLRHVGRRDRVVFCIRGQLRLGLGRPSPLTRRCGARRIAR